MASSTNSLRVQKNKVNESPVRRLCSILFQTKTWKIEILSFVLEMHRRRKLIYYFMKTNGSQGYNYFLCLNRI